MIAESHVTEFIKRVDKERKNITIHGQNKKLSEWQDWYKGKTAWHTYMGSKNGQPQQIERKSSHIAKLIAEIWASNYANEQTTITIPKDEQQEIINNILEENQVLAKFGSFAEKFIALGIGATVETPSNMNTDENGNIIKQDNASVDISFIPATRVLPITVYDGKVTEAAFVKYGTNTCTLQVHLLIDDKYTVAEVKGTTNADTKEYQWDYDNANILHTNNNVPFFQIWSYNSSDNLDLDNAIGSSCYANAIDTFKAIDITFDTFYKEFKNSAKKRYISTDAQQFDESGNLTALVTDDEEIVIPKDIDAKNLIQEFNGEIRTMQIIQGLKVLLNYAGIQCGLGGNMIEIDGTGGRPLQTARAVIAKQTELYRNVCKQENYARNCFKEMLMAIKQINNEYTNNPDLTYEKKEIEIFFDDNLVEDTESKRQRDLSEVKAFIQTPAEYRATWYEEDEDNATKYLQENGLLVMQYLPALQAHAMSPEKFCEIVYGNDDQLEFIKQAMAPAQEPTAPDEFQDEADQDKGQDNNQDQNQDDDE